MNAQALAQVIVRFTRALESADLLFLDKYLADDVVYVRVRPTSTEVTGKDAVIARMEPFLRAFTGWSLDAAGIVADAENSRVTCSLHITGRNAGEIDLRALGQGSYAATGKPFVLPPGRLTLTVRGAEICQIEFDFPEGGGLSGIFAQIGSHR